MRKEKEVKGKIISKKPLKKPLKKAVKKTPSKRKKQAVPMALLGPKWSKGESGNPLGRAPNLEIERQARDAARTDISNAYLFSKDLPLREIKKITKRQDLPPLVIGFARMLHNFASYGQYKQLNIFYDRLIGKPIQGVAILDPEKQQTTIINFDDSYKDI